MSIDHGGPKRHALGIDFGTSNTVAVGRWPDGRARPILVDGSPLLPSAVYAEPNGQLAAGRDAVYSARLDPARFEPNPKRRVDDGLVLLGDREIPVVDLIAAVLERVVEEWRRTVGPVPTDVTLTCPATWGATRRSMLADAAARAGLGGGAASAGLGGGAARAGSGGTGAGSESGSDTVRAALGRGTAATETGGPRLVAEPVAAATYFAEVLGRDVPIGSVVVVHDFGAGTFDASVVARTAEGFEVMAVDGRDDIGGLDIDAAVVEYLQSQHTDAAWQRITEPANVEERRAQRQLWDDVRVAKERLSRSQSADLVVPLLNLEIHLTRDELETLARPVLDQTVQITRRLLRWADLPEGRLAGVFLVGGASRIPLVATLLHRELGEAPVVIEQPELVVAEGSILADAALLAAGPAAPGPTAELRLVFARRNESETVVAARLPGYPGAAGSAAQPSGQPGAAASEAAQLYGHPDTAGSGAVAGPTASVVLADSSRQSSSPFDELPSSASDERVLSAGSSGSVGSAGSSGSVGSAGSSGSVGAPGSVGSSGLVGASGSVGSVGPSGLVGASGSVGSSGSVGGPDSSAGTSSPKPSSAAQLEPSTTGPAGVTAVVPSSDGSADPSAGMGISTTAVLHNGPGIASADALEAESGAPRSESDALPSVAGASLPGGSSGAARAGVAASGAASAGVTPSGVASSGVASSGAASLGPAASGGGSAGAASRRRSSVDDQTTVRSRPDGSELPPAVDPWPHAVPERWTPDPDQTVADEPTWRPDTPSWEPASSAPTSPATGSGRPGQQSGSSRSGSATGSARPISPERPGRMAASTASATRPLSPARPTVPNPRREPRDAPRRSSRGAQTPPPGAQPRTAGTRPAAARPPAARAARSRPRRPGRFLRFLQIMLSVIVLITVPVAAMILAYSYGTGEPFQDAAIQLARDLKHLYDTHIA